MFFVGHPTLTSYFHSSFDMANDAAGEAYHDCDQVVDDYNNDRVTRAAAMRTINRTLSAAGLDDATFERVLETYLVRLDKKDRREKLAQDLEDAMVVNTLTTAAEGIAAIAAEAVVAPLMTGLRGYC